MCSVFDRYTGEIMFVSKEKTAQLLSRNMVRGIKMLKPRFEFLGEINPNFAGKEV